MQPLVRAARVAMLAKRHLLCGWLGLILSAPLSAELAADSRDLDRELERALEEFDRALDRQQSAGEVDILSQQGRAMPLDHGSAFDEAAPGELAAGATASEDQTIAGRASGGSGMDGASSGRDSSDTGEGERADSANGNSGSTDSGALGAGAGGQQPLPVPEDIGDGQGDDIVLRQIREAALRERDPALREKLWDEYRRIKGQ